MFHDIQDTSTLHLKNFSGGVPMFWAHLTAHVDASRVAEFTYQPPEVRYPTFGLGVVGPNANGTCSPEVPVRSWPSWIDWVSGDATAVPVWRQLCKYNRTRICALGARGILAGQSKSK